MPELEEIRPGLHRWTARVPDWTPEQGGPEGWAQDVACVAYEARDALVLIDPLVADGDWGAIDTLAGRHGGPIALVTTCPWHARSSGEAMQRYGNSPEINGWAHAIALEDEERMSFDVANVVRGRAQIADGVEALTTDPGNGELTVWIEPIRTVVAADVLIGAEAERTDTLRVCPPAWLDGQSTVGQVREALRPLLDRGVQAIVPLHGAPVLTGAGEVLTVALGTEAEVDSGS